MKCIINIPNSGKLLYTALILLLFTGHTTYSFQTEDENPKTEIYFEGEVTFNLSYQGGINLVSRDIFKNGEYKHMLIESNRFPNKELGEVLYDFKNLEFVKVWHKKKRVEYLKKKQPGEIDKPKVEETTEYAEILGYKCRKYIVSRYLPTFDRHSTSWAWVAEDLKVKNLEAISKITASANAMASVYEFTDGLVLRLDLLNNTGEISSVMEATELTQMTINPKVFEIPTAEDGYFISGRMY